MNEYKLDFFPGPTDDARQIQRRQAWALDAIYAIHNNKDAYPTQEAFDAALATARQAYDATLTELTTLLGPDAHCNEVDADLYTVFYEVFKSHTGFRPRLHITREGVQKWLKHCQEEQAAEASAAVPAVVELSPAPPSSLLADKLRAALAKAA